MKVLVKIMQATIILCLFIYLCLFHNYNRTINVKNILLVNTMKCNSINIYKEQFQNNGNFSYKFLTKPKCRSNIGLQLNETVDSHITKCSGPMITQRKLGRLGNNICEYLAMKILKLYYQVPVTLMPELFDDIINIFTTSDIDSYNIPCFRNYHLVQYDKLFSRLQHFRGSPLEALKNRAYYISDYPCPMFDLMENRDLFRDSVKFKPNIIEAASSRLNEALTNITRQYSVIISVHVRRTDYNKRLKLVFKRSYLSSCYYKEAMQHFRIMFDNPVFVVASDDLAWCQQNLQDSDVVILEPKPNMEPVIDMATMTLCDHHIIGLGTFGFLGAFLGGRGYIAHSFVLDKELTEFENDLLCSTSPYLIAIPDLGEISETDSYQ